MKEINYEFRQRFSIVHRNDRRDMEKKCPSGFVEVDRSWIITIPDNADVVMMNAARDLEDYFFTSMKVSLKLVRECEAKGAVKKIVYATDASIKEYSYRFAVSENEIILCGCDSRMAAQAGYFLEDLMNLEEGPFVEPVDTVRTSLFNPRMVHSGYGLDMYPTEHLKNIAHSGISSLLVFVNDVDKTPHGYDDFNDLCYRASQYGLDVYAYSYLANKKHPDDPEAYDYYENLYGKFVDRCPLFKGIIFVGESCEFPSKDTHTKGIRRHDNKGPDGKPIVKNNKPSPGWWPCYDYKDLMEMIGGILKKRNPDFDIVLWSYNWSGTPAENRKALIDTLPKYITLQATFEMGERIIRDGIINRTADYTIFSHGPGYYFCTEARFAKENGLKLYSMTNTGGLTWDIGVIPYIPAPYQWMKRYVEMQHAHTTYGLSGTMDSHHFGFSPSFIGDLAKWAFHAPYVDLDETLHKIAARDFSAEVADDVCEAFRFFSDGTYHHISVEADQYGPCRMGPAYPFVLFDKQDIQIPTVPYAHFGGNRITFPVYGHPWGVDVLKDKESSDRYDYEIYSFRIAEELYTKGCEILKAAIEKIPERKKENAYRILALCLFYRNTLRTSINLKEFYKRKYYLLETHGEKRNEYVSEMLEYCRAEVINAEDTIPLVEFDSRLGFEPSMEYMCDKAHIDWKLDLIKEVIEKELPTYYEK